MVGTELLILSLLGVGDKTPFLLRPFYNSGYPPVALPIHLCYRLNKALKEKPVVRSDLQKHTCPTVEDTDRMCIILIFKAWRQYRKVEKWQKDQEEMWRIEKARQKKAEEKRRARQKEKGWEGWEGCDWSKVDWNNPYEYERFVRRGAPWPYPGPDPRVKQYKGS
ncbi:hypothetical protein AOQ84DRAFT_359785 [Glonium stellatum]|uniref:Uncharacterized protein n=1 Tax=Glonium stellatum TaxID=574774 RepID=A0A8E2FAS9_9PEZI|nr:hypothetical protein AOQ84DRAFT_359785 [Glonium stellatum]